VVGLTISALQAVKLFLGELQHIKDAQDMIKRLTDNVQSTEKTLESLRAIDDRAWEQLGPGVTEQCRQAIASCTESCEAFREKLQPSQRWIV
jgi:hypothetical protein